MKKFRAGHLKQCRLLLGCLLLSAIGSGRSEAQSNTIEKITISSPTAASLGKFADIPVGYHTGTPNINIPLYTVKAGSLSLPISLSYHASGIKVQEPAGWAGLGWALNAGGVITRTVRGGPDERNTNAGGIEEKGHFSDHGYNNYLPGGGLYENWLDFSAGRKDGEPDLFFFNFGGYTGKFYFSDDRTPVIAPEQDLRIEYYFPGDTLTGTGVQRDWNIQAFTITTPDGTKYYFGNSPGLSGTAPVETTSPVSDKSGFAGGAVISSWYLNKITSADNQFSISLTYSAETYGYFTVSMYPIDGNEASYGVSYGNYEYNLVKNVISGVRLNQVQFPGGTVTFNAGAARQDLTSGVMVATDTTNSSAAALGSIDISNGSSFCKHFKFSYGYFYDASSSLGGYFSSSGYDSSIHTDRYRLRLDSLSEMNCDSSIRIKPHVFTYYTEQLPRMLSFGIDHWGFANGVITNQRLIPTYFTTYGATHTTVLGADRDAAWPAMRAAALQRIDYPTGGYTQLDFEPHNVYRSYTEDLSVVKLSASVGFDGGSLSTTRSFTADGSAYDVTLDNSHGSYDARLTIQTTGGSTVYTSGYVSAGTSSPLTPSLSAGSYNVILSIESGGNPNPSGHGPQLTFSRWETVTSTGNAIVGGLRIKTMTHNDGVSPTSIVTSYLYTNTGSASSGILYSKPSYVQLIRNDLIETVGFYDVGLAAFAPPSSPIRVNGCPDVGNYYKSPSSIRPMATSQGNHIGYARVGVSQAGNGYSTYNYYTDNSGSYGTTLASDVAVRNIALDVCSSSIPNFPAAPLPFDSKRGELYYEEHFDTSGTLQKSTYYYPVYTTDSGYASQTPGFALATIAVTGTTQLYGTFYQLQTFRKVSMTTVVNEFGNGHQMSTTTLTEFGSPYHNQLTRKVMTNSMGDSLITKLKYAQDFRLHTCDTVNSGASTYASALSSCLATYNSAVTTCGSDASCLSTAYMNYKECNRLARVAYVNLRRANFTDATNVFATNHAAAKSAAGTELKPILQLQDDFDNSLIEKSDWKNTNLLSSVFTHYDYMANPSGFVYPQKARTIELLAPSSTFTPAATSSNDQSVDADSRYTDLSSFAFNYANLAHITKRDGVTESYLWDYGNQYPVAKTDNAAESQVAYASFEADGTGNWDYSSSGVRSDSGSVTGNKAFKLASGVNIQRTGLNSSTTYLVTYWVKGNGDAAAVNSAAGTLLTTRNGWKLYSNEITGVTTATVSGAAVVDELRLYPKNAQMTTYTYDPLVGITSQCDNNNRIMFYQYDPLGRLLRVLDQDKNILKKNQYVYQEAQ